MNDVCEKYEVARIQNENHKQLSPKIRKKKQIFAFARKCGSGLSTENCFDQNRLDKERLQNDESQIRTTKKMIKNKRNFYCKIEVQIV